MFAYISEHISYLCLIFTPRVNPIKLFGINYIKIKTNVNHGKIQLVEIAKIALKD